MTEPLLPPCPECVEPTNAVDLHRRKFLHVAGGVAVAGLGAGVLRADTPAAPAAPRPAEALVAELFENLSAEQKKAVVLPFDDGPRNAPTRLRVENAALKGQSIAMNYSAAQRELLEKIVRALANGEEGYKALSRDGTWDASKDFGNCGAHIFGEPGTDKPYAFLFTGHHLTIRCDGNRKDNLVWGGPMYYGHTPNGHAPANVFNFQTKSINTLYRALTADQKKLAVGVDSPGDTLRPTPGNRYVGIAGSALTAEQKALCERSLCDILAPYRKEDADEVIASILALGGLDKLHFAFYRDADVGDADRWSLWRVEGPNFVWNYRVLPHVHCRVLIGKA